ncbi:MAG: hypothetical protein QM581_13630 [Pseudomonas sp.]
MIDRLKRTPALLLGAWLLAVPAIALAQTRQVGTGENWVVKAPVSLTRLSLAEGGRISAPPGKVLTLTVDGVGREIAPGSYAGKIALTPSTPLKWTPMLGGQDYAVRSALYVENGKVDAARSVAAARKAGVVTDAGAADLRVDSRDPGFNGVIIEGAGDYVLDRPVIDLEGPGTDDAIGVGAGITIKKGAHVVINDPRIRTHGVVRTAIFADSQAKVQINRAEIETRGGQLPADYKFSILPGEMKEVPYGLGISGTVRATNAQAADVTYQDSYIKAWGWGGLATDGAGPTKLTLINSVVEVEESGYAAYSNGEATDIFDHSVLRAPTYGLVTGGPGSALFTNGTVVDSGKYGVMSHQGDGKGTVRLEKGSVLLSRLTAFTIKGRNKDIEIDDARVVAGNGILLQTMENDDPIMVEHPMPPGQGPGAGDKPAPQNGTRLQLSNASVRGDVYHALTGKGGLKVELRNAALTGAISLATTRPSSGHAPTHATFETVNDVVDTSGFSTTDEPLEVALEAASVWTVTGDSYLSGLDIAQGARIAAPSGQKLRLELDGRQIEPKAGHYSGKIRIQVVNE